MSRRGDQQEWLQSLARLRSVARQGLEQTLFLARNRPNNRPGAWIDQEFWDWNIRPDFRTLLWNELCFDLDHPQWRYNWTTALKLQRYLTDRAIEHYFFASAGKGIHCSIFLDAAGAQAKYGWQAIRSSLFNRICREVKITGDPMKIHWNDATMGSMLRTEGGLRFAPFTKIRNFEVWDERFSDNTFVLYKHWLGSTIPKDKPLVTRPGKVEYPPAPHTWRFPMEWLPEPEEPRVFRGERAPAVSVKPLIRKLVEFMAAGNDLCDYGRYVVAVHCLKSGYTVDEAVELYKNTPDFNDYYTRRKLEQLFDSIDRAVPPGRKAILERLGTQVAGLSE